MIYDNHKKKTSYYNKTSIIDIDVKQSLWPYEIQYFLNKYETVIENRKTKTGNLY